MAVSDGVLRPNGARACSEEAVRAVVLSNESALPSPELLGRLKSGFKVHQKPPTRFLGFLGEGFGFGGYGVWDPTTRVQAPYGSVWDGPGFSVFGWLHGVGG